MIASLPIKVSGRFFGNEQLNIIRDVISTSPTSLRTEIARRVCTALDWRDARGDLKAMSCRVALLRLHREGLIELPAPRNGNGNGKPLTLLCQELLKLFSKSLKMRGYNSLAMYLFKHLQISLLVSPSDVLRST
jgi:hypothetical protein